MVAQLPRGLSTSTRTSTRATGRGTSGCAWSPTATCSARSARGQASIVTDRIERFTAAPASQLASGAELDADIIVTATGLNLLAFGGIELAVDGEPVSLPEQLAYKGMMLSRVPNFAFTIGYTNASWTLKADLVAEYVCRLLAHMERSTATASACPVDDDPAVERVAAAGLRRRLRPALDRTCSRRAARARRGGSG